uniref:Putative BTB-POZ domain-containing protein n=1 Tax=Borely moumouvirus TaxID=2712067 RepID=A0A6G6ADG5_9VIRU
MDFSQVYESNVFYDVELVLFDKKNKKFIKLHKLLLHNGSPFFQKLFTIFFNNKIKPQIILEVFDVDVCVDIIKTFYGIKILPKDDWKYQISNYICKQQLLLSNNLPKELKIPENEFEEFLSIIQSREYNDEIIDLIATNLPLNFNLDKLPIELIKKINERYIDFQILAVGNKGIYIVNLNNNTHNKIINASFENIDYNNNLNKIIIRKGYSTPCIYSDGFCVYDLSGNEINLDSCCENKKIIGLLKNLDIKHRTYICDLIKESKYSVRYFKYSSDYEKIIFTVCESESESDSDSDSDSDINDNFDNYVSENLIKGIYFYDLKTGEIKEIYGNKYTVCYIKDKFYVSENNIIFIGQDAFGSAIFLYSFTKNKFEKVCYLNYKDINLKDNIDLKYNGDDIILFNEDKNIKIYSLSKQKIINNLEKKLDHVDFVTKEIIVGSKNHQKGINFYVYNIITNILIKHTSIDFYAPTDFYTENIKYIPGNNSKNRIQQYLKNL